MRNTRTDAGRGATNQRRNWAKLGLTAAILSAAPSLALGQEQPKPAPARAAQSGDVVVTARRVSENLQDVPIPVSVIGGALLADSGTANVLKLKELVPTLQIFSSNPRNTAINIRGLGTTFGLTNDGVDIGVGLYVDGVFWPRAAQSSGDVVVTARRVSENLQDVPIP
ncbi:MAG: TonB-dependent receptor plug domain-containing protein, partial [Terricaulis silvestris]